MRRRHYGAQKELGDAEGAEKVWVGSSFARAKTVRAGILGFTAVHTQSQKLRNLGQPGGSEIGWEAQQAMALVSD